MKYLIATVIIFSFLAAQDILITTNGVKYSGKYERSTDERIFFLENGKEFAAGVKKDMIDIVILADGTVIYSAGEVTEKKLAKAGKQLDEIKIAQVKATTEVNANLELRQTLALEKIATAQTFFMYYAIAIIALTLIFTASASASAG